VGLVVHLRATSILRVDVQRYTEPIHDLMLLVRHGEWLSVLVVDFCGAIVTVKSGCVEHLRPQDRQKCHLTFRIVQRHRTLLVILGWAAVRSRSTAASPRAERHNRHLAQRINANGNLDAALAPFSTASVSTDSALAVSAKGPNQSKR
jgi:hypothetical protein